MTKTKKENRWQRWEKEVEKFKRELSAKDSPPPVVIRQWRRHLLFIFMQELSKNLLDEQETFDSIIDRIIVAIQVGCGFECVRFYGVKDKTIYLDRFSEGHDPVEKEKDKLLNELVHQSVRLVNASGGHLKLKDKQTGEWKLAAS